MCGSGKINVGDKLIAVDGWPCYGQATKDVTAKITGSEDYITDIVTIED